MLSSSNRQKYSPKRSVPSKSVGDGCARAVTHEQMFSVGIGSRFVAMRIGLTLYRQGTAPVGLDAPYVQQRTCEFCTLLMPYSTGYGGGLTEPMFVREEDQL